ncbi:MAG TPA: UDP-N-acetylmuramoyl-tripeptide--D-alanyl-D-alanine ligase [Gemmatimonadales bacterium]|nr:UDP-N-acetylmuramoyl-tripeptide--D-alanyl-D-alanine ligase [Gemmatimonadales bacterium]
MRWSAAAVQAALGLSGGESGEEITSISTDTRTLQPGALFVALVGDKHDGHDHLAAARDAGARTAIVRRGTPAVKGLALIEVDDTLRAYGDLAHARRKQVSGPVIAITGTNGKTSTKEMVAAVLRTRFRTHATRLNYNNLVGVPLTILEAPDDTEALVIEAGANMPGEIARYREIIEPTIAIVTNVAEGHLEGFGSLEGVLAEKLALLRDVPLAIVGTEPPALAERARQLARREVTAGAQHAERKARDIEIDGEGKASFTAGGQRIHLPLPGRHLASNAMLAWTVVEELGLDPHSAAQALEGLQLPGGRSEVLQRGGFTILNDCYNANPQSFASVIATAKAMRQDRRLVFVAGTMRELGSASERLHAQVAEQLLLLKPDLLAAVGDFVPALEPHRAALGERLVTAPDPTALAPLLSERLSGGELLVLKASRGVALERILPLLTPRTASADEG